MSKQRPTDIVQFPMGSYVVQPDGKKVANGPPPEGLDMRTAEPGKDGWKALTYGHMLSMLVMGVKGDTPDDRARQFRVAMRIGDKTSDPGAGPLLLEVDKAVEIINFIKKLAPDHELAVPMYQGAGIAFLEDTMLAAARKAKKEAQNP